MSWDAREFTRKLKERLDRFDKPAAAGLCEELVGHLLETEDDYPAREAERVLQALRNKRMFSAMETVGDALIQTGRASTKARRQYAQALIERGNLTAALAVLGELTLLTETDPVENAEARGLVGRVHKQFYVNTSKPSLQRNREHLRRAIAAYFDAYRTAPAERLWHGINVVALVRRAERDGISTTAFPDATQLAEAILSAIDEKDTDQRADMWDFGTAMEACVALGRSRDAVKWLDRYVADPDSDAFELGNTLRQLTEVWGLNPQTEPGNLLLPILHAKLLEREGGKVEIGPQDLQVERRAGAKIEYEKVFGADSFQSYKWYATGLQRCQLVARIGLDSAKGYGTGFLVKGSDVSPAYGDEPLLLTNAHVVSNDPEVRKAHAALVPEEAVIMFEALGPEEYRVAELLWTSPPEQLDATLLRIENVEALQAKVNEIPVMKLAKTLPIVEETTRVYVIGHPLGGTLSFSLQDNLLLDHEDPRIHYRTPTEGGSSGSPVFNRQWDLIGLHHAGSKTMPRLNGKSGTYAANEGIWLHAIIRAISQKSPAG